MKSNKIAEQSNVDNDSLSRISISKVFSKLPHSAGRVPYTYHHDYLRMNVERFRGSSRSDVASSHMEDMDELYAVALTQLLDELKFTDTMNLSKKDIEICKRAIATTKYVVNRYSTELNPS